MEVLSLIKKLKKKSSLPPGSLVYVGDVKKDAPVKVHMKDYDSDRLEEAEQGQVESFAPFRNSGTTTWVDIDGVHDVGLIERIGDDFELHPLLLEDIVNTHQRAKLEEYGEHLFCVVKVLFFDEGTMKMSSEQVSLVLGPHYVISFQERQGDVFEGVRRRIREGKGRIRRMGPDYLLYALLDAIVDSYLLLLEKMGAQIDTLDEELMSKPGPDTLKVIHVLKQEVVTLRRSVWPLRDVLTRLHREEHPLISGAAQLFFRDVYDHTLRVIETLDIYRDMVFGMMDTYLTVVSFRMNEVMKVLTIIATIFIPLTFIAGIYGMNFDNMPELHWAWGYFLVLTVMALLGGTMAYLFMRKGWL